MEDKPLLFARDAAYCEYPTTKKALIKQRVILQRNILH